MTDLPEGWRKVALGELTKIKYGKSLDKLLRDEDGLFPVVGSAGVMTRTSAPLISEACVVVGRKGNVGAVQYFPNGCYPIDTVYYFIAPNEIKTKFLTLSLENKKLKHLDSSTAIPSLRREDLEGVELGIPPLAEQERIVEILEEQFSRLDSALASVKLVREKAKAFRRSLLHSAFSGEMTGGTEGWREVALGEVADLSLGVMLDKKKETGLNQVPYLANINVRWGAFDLTDLKEMQVMPQQAERAEIRFGDVVACEGGEPARAAVWLSDKSVAIQKALHRIRPRPETSPFFILYFLEKRFRGAGDDPLFTGTTIKHLPKEKLKDLVLPFPPLATQERIVSVLEEQFSRLDNALEVANQLEARIASERRSLLHAAFTGALTATWRETHV